MLLQGARQEARSPPPARPLARHPPRPVLLRRGKETFPEGNPCGLATARAPGGAAWVGKPRLSTCKNGRVRAEGKVKQCT